MLCLEGDKNNLFIWMMIRVLLQEPKCTTFMIHENEIRTEITVRAEKIETKIAFFLLSPPSKTSKRKLWRKICWPRINQDESRKIRLHPRRSFQHLFSTTSHVLKAPLKWIYDEKVATLSLNNLQQTTLSTTEKVNCRLKNNASTNTASALI